MILLNRPEYKLEKWWTFREVLKIYNPTLNIMTSWGVSSYKAKEFFQRFGISTSEITIGTDDGATCDLLMTFLVRRYWEHYCIMDSADSIGYSSNVEEQAQMPVYKFIQNMVNIWNFTKDKYSKLLAIYEAQKDNLLNKVETIASGTTRFNDTPQDSGDYSDDTHTTNISQTSGASSTDVDTLMARIDEISKKFENVMLRWVNEFDSLFIEEGNIE